MVLPEILAVVTVLTFPSPLEVAFELFIDGNKKTIIILGGKFNQM